MHLSVWEAERGGGTRGLKGARTVGLYNESGYIIFTRHKIFGKMTENVFFLSFEKYRFTQQCI